MKILKVILAVTLIAVVCIGTTGCGELLQILEYLGTDFYFGDGSYSGSSSSYIYDYGIDYTDYRILPDIPDRDFHGYGFMILGEKKSDGSLNDIAADEFNGDIINDSVYKRNRLVEERYNLRIEGVFHEDPSSIAKKVIAAGLDEYDMFAVPMSGAARMTTQGFLVNLYDVPYIDFSKPWWDRNANQQLSVANKLFFTAGDMLLGDKEAASVFLFNKMLLMDYGLEMPYQLVKNGLWTVEKMQEMAKAVSMDLNGDGSMTKYDLFGFVANGDMLYDCVLSSNASLIAKDKDGLPVAGFLSDRALTSFEKWTDIYYDPNTAFITWDFDNRFTMFEQSRGLFMNENMLRVPKLRRQETDFGIIPYPKLDVTQANYRNAVNPSIAGAVSVPVTNPDLDRTGIIIEALSAESRYTVLPAYYDMSLMAKFYRDEESAEMLDIIFYERCYDLGQIYNFGGLNEMFIDMTKNKNDNFVSQYAKNEARIAAAIDKFIAMLEYLN